MKTNGTRFVLYALVAELLFLLFSFTTQAQRPDYVFRNATLVSGTDKKIGAKYRFRNVYSNTDAYVTITDIQRVTLNQFDGGGGFDDAFQPYIYCPGKTKGYVEFRFDFVTANTVIPKLMTEVPVTAIDIDGYINPDEKVYEFDEFNLSLGYLVNFDMLGSALNVNFKGTTVGAENKTAKDYPGIDTVQRDVMFTMIYSSVSTITIRAGVENKSVTGIERLRSDYFKRFSYANSALAKPSLVSFTGLERNSKVDLNWTLSGDQSLNKVIIEKGTSPNTFKPIGEVWMDNNSKTRFNYTDNSGINQVAYYRLKMVNADGEVRYSNILTFRAEQTGSQPFKVYPSVVNSSVSVSVRSTRTGPAVFQVVDYAGRIVNQQNVIVQEGNNNVVVSGLGNIPTGNYVAVLRSDDNQSYTQKITKQ